MKRNGLFIPLGGSRDRDSGKSNCNVSKSLGASFEVRRFHNSKIPKSHIPHSPKFQIPNTNSQFAIVLLPYVYYLSRARGSSRWAQHNLRYVSYLRRHITTPQTTPLMNTTPLLSALNCDDSYTYFPLSSPETLTLG